MKNKKKLPEKLSLKKSIIAGLTQDQLNGGSSYPPTTSVGNGDGIPDTLTMGFECPSHSKCAPWEVCY